MHEDFNRAKETLLKYYSDVQISLGARLLGFGVVLFALIEAYRNFNGAGSGKGLFELMFDPTAVYPLFSLLKGMLFLSGVLFLIVYLVRTVFRYAAISGFCCNIQTVEPFDGSSVHGEISKKVYNKMLRNDKDQCAHVFVWFPFSWFMTGDRTVDGKMEDVAKKEMDKDIMSGWIVSLFAGIIITIALAIILW
jgi:hypothetical protein